jgi:hypothetical protein
MRNSDWIEFREAYIDWMAEWPKRSGIKELLRWHDYSMWWSTNLVAKDSYNNFGWLARLCERVLRSEVREPLIKKRRRGPTFFLILLLNDIAKFFVTKIYFRNQPRIQSDIIFYSMEMNLLYNGNVLYDRHYGATLLKDQEYGHQSSYLLKLDISPTNLLRPFRWYKQLSKKIHDLEHNTTIVDTNIKLYDLLSIHFVVFIAWCKFFLIKNKKYFRDCFVIKGVACDDILIAELEQSFFGPIQNSLVQAFMIRGFLKSCGEKSITLINYLELVASARPIYHFAKLDNRNDQFVIIQHAVKSKNNLGFYHRKTEFNFISDNNSVVLSQLPDHYFVHGTQFANIAEEFFPKDKIHIIGCLKYDHYKLLRDEVDKNRKRMSTKIKKGNEKIIIVAPSFGGDIYNILSVICSDISTKNKIRFIISPHPLDKQEEILKLSQKLGCPLSFEFFPEHSTQDLLFIADLVVCGYSSIALESVIFDVPSIRIIDKHTIPLVEGEPAIDYVFNSGEFWDSINKLSNESLGFKKRNVCLDMVSSYFYRIDGHSTDRFWKTINEITVPNH